MICFSVIGAPAPKGSGRAMLRGGRAIYVPGGSSVNQAKIATWRESVIAACADMESDARILDGAVGISTVYRFPMRRGDLLHGHARPTAPLFHTTKPDADKLERATFDALTAAGVWRDDSQVAHSVKSKCYVAPGEWTGARIAIIRLDVSMSNGTYDNRLSGLHFFHAGCVVNAWDKICASIASAPTRKQRRELEAKAAPSPVFDEAGGEW